MINLTSILESIERLTYDILIWVLLVPKTLIKIVTDPGWVHGYVTSELQDRAESKFDDYISPVILIILTSLVPFLYFYLTPPPSLTISGPETIAINTDAVFIAHADFISDGIGDYRFVWSAEDYDKETLNQLTLPRDNQWYRWSSPGIKTVRVNVRNGDGEFLGKNKDVYVYNPGEGQSERLLSIVQPSDEIDKGDYLSVLQGPIGILATIIILSIPLLFAIAMDASPRRILTRSSLRPSFYIQCYYFAPVNLTMWASLIGNYFFLTPREVELQGLTVLIMMVMFLWLIWNETSLIAKERRIHPVFSLFIVLLCVAVVVGVGIGVLFLRDTEIFRLFVQYTYFAIVGIVILIHIVKEYILPLLRRD